jgi:hypothetical protein
MESTVDGWTMGELMKNAWPVDVWTATNLV